MAVVRTIVIQILILISLPLASFAQELESREVAPSEQVLPPAPAETQAPIETSYIEQTRQAVTDRVLRLSDSIDSLFGNTKYEDKYNTSTLHVSQTVYTKDGRLGAESLEASLNLYLPNLKQMEENIRNYLFPSESSKASTAGESSEEEKSNWDFNQESGVVVTLPINYFARVRARTEFLTGRFVNSFYEQIGWSKNNEWEEKTSLTSDFALNRYLLFRFVNDLDWAMTNNVLGSTHGPSLIYQISDTRGISFDFRYSTLIETTAIYTNRMALGSTYRQETPLQWVFMSLNPEIAWERDTNFRPLYNIYLTFDFIFGKREAL